MHDSKSFISNFLVYRNGGLELDGVTGCVDHNLENSRELQ